MESHSQVVPPSLLFADTSWTGRGVPLQDHNTLGMWFSQERELLINVFEMKAVQLALIAFPDRIIGGHSSNEQQHNSDSILKEARGNNFSAHVQVSTGDNSLIGASHV